jgi:hypothetical protein
MTRTARAGVLVTVIAGGLAAGGLAGAVEVGGRDLAAGLRGLASIRGAAIGAAVTLPQSGYASAEKVGVLANAHLTETSGLAVSRRSDGLFWAANDSGTAPRLYAIGADGRDRGFAQVAPQASAVDWEDLASFSWKGRPYLLVADTGDNMSWRTQVELFVVAEPPLTGESLPAGTTAPVAWRIPFRFEDGPRDCEAIAIDAAEQRVLLISKRTEPPGLYSLPLLPSDVDAAPKDADGRLVARRIGDVPGIPPPTKEDVKFARFLGRYLTMPTALDISPDGRFAVVLSYREAYLFTRAAGETWPEAFARPPDRIPTPGMSQAEAIAFARDGRTLYVTSEGQHAPLFRLAPAAPR